MIEKEIKLHPKQFDAFNFKTQFGAAISGIQCIDENEFVYTPNGIKLVKEIKDGDKILGGIVKNRYEFQDDLYEITFNNGIKIRTNKEHPFYCKVYREKTGKWLKLKEILDLPKKEGITTARVYFYPSSHFEIKDKEFNNLIKSKLYKKGNVGNSKKQAYELQYILWRLGIRSHIRKEINKSTQSFYRVVVDRNQNDDWISIEKIKRVGKGKVVGWETIGSNEIISYCGMKTHNSGKTFLGTIWAQKKINEFPDKNGLIAAPSYKLLQQSTLEKFFQLFPEYRKYYKQQQGVIELPTGGKVFIRSADEPLGLEGMTLSWAWLDEAGMMNRLVWVVIRSRVSIAGGQVLITSTPYAINWLYQDFYLPWKEGKDKDLSVFTWRSIDNPYFPKDFYDKERQRLTPQEFSRRYEGEFSRMEGLVYDLPNEQIIEPKTIENAEITLAGIDWGFKNPAAIVVLKFKDKVWYVVDEWYQTEKTTTEIIEQAKILQAKWGINRFYPDPHEPDRIEECRRAGLYVLESNDDVMGGVSRIQQLIREKRLYVFNTCKNFIDEINFYHFPEVKDDKTNRKENPEKKNDHLMDATRYVINTYDQLETQEVPFYTPNFQIY